MASVGNLVVNLEANTRGFQRSMQQSQQALQSFAQTAKKTTEAAHTLDSIGANRQLPAQLDATAKQMGDLGVAMQAASEQVRRYEEIADKAAVATHAASVAAARFGGAGQVIATGTATVSHGLHSVLIGAIAVRRTLESLAWIFGVIADGARMLLVPLRLVWSAMQMMAQVAKTLLLPLKAVAGGFIFAAKAVMMVLGPFIGLASGAFKLFIQFKALQLQAKLMKAIFDMLPPRIKAVAVTLFAVGAAGRVASGVLSRLGFVGRGLQAVLRGVAAALKAVINPMATLGVVTRATAGAIKAFVSSALGPLSLALSGFGAVLAAGGMLTLAADAEKLSIQLEVLTGNAETAAQLVETLNKFAGATPFNKMDIKAAAVQLLGVQTPIKEITSDLSMLANIAAMSDNSILELTRMFAQLRTTGTASLQDLQEYSTRNIMLMQHLAKRFGNVAAAASAGQITFDDVRRALYEMSLQADSLSKLNKSLSGQFARLKNNLLVVATAIGNQVLPHATKLLNWASDMIERLGGLEDKLGFLKDVLVAVFDVAFEGIKEKWSELLDWMKTQGKAKAMGIAESVVMFVPNMIGKAVGQAVARNRPAGPIAQPKPTGLEAATARLNEVLARLKPIPQPDVKPNLGLLPEVKADVGKGVSGFFNQALDFGQNLIQGGIAGIDKQLMQGAAFINQFSGLIGDKKESTQQQEARMAGAMQKGSADAYSAIIGAMMSKKDPLLTATEKQTKATVEPLVDIVGLIKAGGIIGKVKEFAGAF
jgi:hypothetical protein